MSLLGAENAVKTEGSSEVTEVSSVTVLERISPFWTDQSRLLFTQLEAFVAPQKQGDEFKYNLVTYKLSKDEIQHISDLMLYPSETEKYGSLKERLNGCYDESEQWNFQKLLSESDLGYQKPSQLLKN